MRAIADNLPALEITEGLEPIKPTGLDLADLDELTPAAFRFYTERLYRWTKAAIAADYPCQLDPRIVYPSEWAAATPAQRLVLLVGASNEEAERHPLWSAWSKLQDPGPADGRPLREWWPEVLAELEGEAFASLRAEHELNLLWDGIQRLALDDGDPPAAILRALRWALDRYKHRAHKVDYPATWTLSLMRNELNDAARRRNERT